MVSLLAFMVFFPFLETRLTFCSLVFRQPSLLASNFVLIDDGTYNLFRLIHCQLSMQASAPILIENSTYTLLRSSTRQLSLSANAFVLTSTVLTIYSDHHTVSHLYQLALLFWSVSALTFCQDHHVSYLC